MHKELSLALTLLTPCINSLKQLCIQYKLIENNVDPDRSADF